MEFIAEMLADFVGEVASLQLYKILYRLKREFKGNKAR